MNKIVLDASALLALLNSEPGSEKLTPDVLSDGVVSAVNLAEVHGKLVASGLPPDDAWNAVLSVVGEIADFTPEQARLTGALVLQTRTSGLSLGDRACLALGLLLKAPVYTADRSWKNLRLPIPVRLIR